MQFSRQLAGQYEADVRMGGETVGQARLVCDVRPAAVSAGHCRAEGVGLDESVVGRESHFSVHVHCRKHPIEPIACSEQGGGGAVFASPPPVHLTKDQWAQWKAAQALFPGE